MSDRILRKAILKAEEDYADDGQVEAAQTEAVEEATKRSAPPTEEELRMLVAHARIGRRAPVTKPIRKPARSSIGSKTT